MKETAGVEEEIKQRAPSERLMDGSQTDSVPRRMVLQDTNSIADGVDP
jgi:hypothetical protein